MKKLISHKGDNFLQEINEMKKVSKLKRDHLEWRELNFKQKSGFFPVFKEFKSHMGNLSPGAISLFLYLGLHSNNLTGESSHGIERMAKFFNKSTRTISSWLKELEKEGLIERVQIKFNGPSHTFIKPYSDLIKQDLDDELPF